MKRLRPLVIEPTAGQHPVRNHQDQIRHEQVGRGLLVAVELVDGDAQVGLSVSRILQLDNGDRQPVQEHGQVRANDLARGSGDAELAHHQQLVRGRFVEIDQPGTTAARLAAAGVAVLDLDAVGEQRMEPAVVLEQRRVRRAREDAHHLLDALVRQIGIETMQGSAETACE
jgi:hypothetical protein